MVLDILGVIKRLFSLSSYNLTFQLIILNLIIVFLGLVFLSYFNFNLIQNNKFIDNRDQSIRLNLSNITKYLENTSILRVPIFQYDYRCRYLQDIEAYKESCDLADNINPIELSEPELEKFTTEQFIFQNFGDKDFNTIIYNENWIKIADSSNLFLSTDVEEIDLSETRENIADFSNLFEKIYIKNFNYINNYILKNKFTKNLDKNVHEIILIIDTIKEKQKLVKTFEDENNDITRILTSPIIQDNKVYGVVLIKYKLLLNNTFFDKIFIPFAPADNGGALGSAIYTYCQNGNKINNIQTPYLGSDFNNQEIEKLLKNYVNKYNLKIQKFNNFDELCEKAVDQLTNDSVIGWFQGKMEFGPRSLGNRSILADPRKKNMKDIINKKIKRRENFRPFAPSVLKEYQHEWFEENFDNLYMSSVMSVKTNKINLIPAVVHVDGSSRVQTVKKENNNKFHNLISKFYIKTKIPMLLNTSFNENEPIVRKPEEAINCLLRTDMDSLYINDFCIEKIR